jgi:PAB1-binding protein PBP1
MFLRKEVRIRKNERNQHAETHTIGIKKYESTISRGSKIKCVTTNTNKETVKTSIPKRAIHSLSSI